MRKVLKYRRNGRLGTIMTVKENPRKRFAWQSSANTDDKILNIVSHLWIGMIISRVNLLQLSKNTRMFRSNNFPIMKSFQMLRTTDLSCFQLLNNFIPRTLIVAAKTIVDVKFLSDLLWGSYGKFICLKPTSQEVAQISENSQQFRKYNSLWSCWEKERESRNFGCVELRTVN